ncbi:hypothetical protein PP175_18090 [Aneurinibacillus sp. Ricciae_BoGa-3]|uniref:hypothetical protein n=1 Tax=Aneurinibacillus sp. Ricciae_BoGa-3 TaxID=3022697 RepID=UPI00234048D0|nr:hypothetical protein [Aneurinibacillus sp. Ricciae_BoGa-3]WCK53292.1 hypothetical protein PP175_18090 [Aneurinibacillus sp. Ricciae_BoGa-3]
MIKAKSFKEIIKLIEEKDGAELTLNEGLMGMSFHWNNYKEKTELYLKIKNDRLVISRIAFNHKRRGTGTQVLELLKEWCRANNFKYIAVERADTLSIVEFIKSMSLSQSIKKSTSIRIA